MKGSRTVDTEHGTIDADVLAELRQGFATSELVAALDALDVCERRHKWLRACLLRLHAMASHLINGVPRTVSGEEPIWQLAEEIADELDAHATSVSHVTRLVDRLAKLRPNDKTMPGTRI